MSNELICITFQPISASAFPLPMPYTTCVVYIPPDCSVPCFADGFLENYMHALKFEKEIFVSGEELIK